MTINIDNLKKPLRKAYSSILDKKGFDKTNYIFNLSLHDMQDLKLLWIKADNRYTLIQFANAIRKNKNILWK